MEHRSDPPNGAPPDPRLTEDLARRLWERAARLQAATTARRSSGDLELDPGLAPGVDDGRLSLSAVRRAAVEAGIDSRWVDAALIDLDGPEQGAVDRWAARFLGDASPTAVASRDVRATLEQVWASLQRVLPSDPFRLVLKRVVGGRPLEGGTLVFDVPLLGASLDGLLMQGPVADLRHWAEFRQIRLRMEAVEGAPHLTRVVLSAPRVHARRTNFWVGQILGVCTGVVLGAIMLILVALGAPLAGVGGGLAWALSGGAAAAAAGVGWWAGSRLWRRFHRYGQRRGESALEEILDGIDLDLETGGAFRRPVGDGSPSPSARTE